MSTIKTRNCVICGSPDVVEFSGHVIRKNTYATLYGSYQDIIIITSKCAKHREERRENGYFGEYKEWMGMCDDPFKKEVKKENPDFKEITNRVLNYIAVSDDEVNRQIAEGIGIDMDYFEDYLDYAKVKEVVDTRDED